MSSIKLFMIRIIAVTLIKNTCTYFFYIYIIPAQGPRYNVFLPLCWLFFKIGNCTEIVYVSYINVLFFIEGIRSIIYYTMYLFSITNLPYDKCLYIIVRKTYIIQQHIYISDKNFIPFSIYS